MVILQCGRLALAGAAIGCLCAIGLTRFLANLLYGVKPEDPMSFLAAPLVLGSVALLAAWIPALRASRVDPSAALRSE
jgi:putative ABC transport system permease protein